MRNKITQYSRIYTNLYTFLLELILNQIWCVFVEQQWKSQKR